MFGSIYIYIYITFRINICLLLHIKKYYFIQFCSCFYNFIIKCWYRENVSSYLWLVILRKLAKKGIERLWSGGINASLTQEALEKCLQFFFETYPNMYLDFVDFRL